MLGMHGTYEANMTMHNADVILCIGARFDDRVTNNPAKFCPNAKVIHIDIDPATISKTIMAHIPIVGAVEPVLQEMLTQLKQMNVSKPNPEDIAAWWAQINEWRKVHGMRYESGANGVMKPQQVVEALDKITNGDAIITSDVGQHQMFGANYYKYKRPRQWINSGGLGTMGVGLPYAMAAKLAFPDQQVVCITGEASIQMCIQELSTCKQYGLNVKILCLNNQALGMVKQWQDMNYEGRHSSSYVDSLPDFPKLMEAYGHVGIQIDHADELESKLAEAMAINDKCVFINVMVDRTEHVYPMLIAGQSMQDMWLGKGERTS
jgi:acetolactate synthase-1/2/3 large subunit